MESLEPIQKVHFFSLSWILIVIELILLSVAAVRDRLANMMATFAHGRVDSTIEGFPRNVVYDASYVPPSALPPPAFPPFRGYRCLLCLSSGPHFGVQSEDNKQIVSAVSVSSESIKQHLRKYHHSNTRDAHRSRNTSSTEPCIKHTWIQKVYASKLGYFEVAPDDPKSIHEFPQINVDSETATHEQDNSPDDRDVMMDNALPHDQKEAFFQAQLIKTTADHQVRLSETSCVWVSLECFL